VQKEKHAQVIQVTHELPEEIDDEED